MPGLKFAQIFAARAKAHSRVPQQSVSMRRTVMALLGLLIGYPVFAVAGDWVIQLLSGSSFDRSLEASVIAVFAIGPIGAVIGLVVGMVVGGKTRLAKTAPVASPIAPPDAEDI